MTDYRAIWRLDDIHQGIARIRELLEDRSFEDVEADWKIRAALERCFQVVCEAARHLPEEWCSSYRDVPWRQVIDLGNQLRHAYHRVNLRLLWRIYTDDLDQLDITVARMIDEFGPVPERPERLRRDS